MDLVSSSRWHTSILTISLSVARGYQNSDLSNILTSVSFFGRGVDVWTGISYFSAFLMVTVGVSEVPGREHFCPPTQVCGVCIVCTNNDKGFSSVRKRSNIDVYREKSVFGIVEALIMTYLKDTPTILSINTIFYSVGTWVSSVPILYIVVLMYSQPGYSRIPKS